MEGHFFMSNGLKGRIQGELETLSENIVFIHDNENETFTSGYRSFFASPGILSVEGTLNESWTITGEIFNSRDEK